MRTRRLALGLLAIASCARGAPAPAAPPSPPAAAVATPAPTCPATIDRAEVLGDRYPDWTTAWRALRDDAQPPPATEAEARERLCGDAGCPGSGPWLVRQDLGLRDLMVRADLVFQEPHGLRVVPQVGRGHDQGCPWADALTLTVDGDLVHLSRRRHAMIELSLRVDERGIDRCEPGEPGCGDACLLDEFSRTDRFFDRTGYQLLAIERHTPLPDQWPRPQLEVDEPSPLVRTDHRVDLPGCAAPVTIPSISSHPTATCPGERDGELCMLYLSPTCAPDEHARALDCRPVCVATASCLTP